MSIPEFPRVLLAEDNPVCQRVAAAMLHHLGYQVDVRGTGRAAVAASLNWAYDVIIMDGFMPDMDGFEAAREIRRLERGRRTPIVALTATLRPKDRQRCFDAGMDDCLAKPVTPEVLSAVLTRFTHRTAPTARRHTIPSR